MKFIRLSLVLIFASTVANGRAATKAGLVADIMKAYGVEDSLEATRVEMVKQANGAMKGAIDQIRTSLPQISEDGWKRINESAEKYLKAATGSWNGADLVKEYSQVYEERYSLEELTALAGYVKSAPAQKSIETEKRAAKVMNDYILSHMVVSMQAAMKIFVTELQAIMKDEVARMNRPGPNQPPSR